MNPNDLRNKLSPLAYSVTQEKGTERPFTSEFAETWHDGAYTVWCVMRCCLRRKINSTQVAAGRVLMRLLHQKQLPSIETSRTA